MTSLTTAKKNWLSPFTNRLLGNADFMSPRIWDFDSDFFDMDFTFRVPSVNIIENDKDFKITMAAPGMQKKDFKIEVDEGILTISAEQKEESKDEKENYSRREFSYHNFSRSFRLPENCLFDKIDARYDNGMLFLTLPKKEFTVRKALREIKVA